MSSGVRGALGGRGMAAGPGVTAQQGGGDEARGRALWAFSVRAWAPGHRGGVVGGEGGTAKSGGSGGVAARVAAGPGGTAQQGGGGEARWRALGGGGLQREGVGCGA